LAEAYCSKEKKEKKVRKRTKLTPKTGDLKFTRQMQSKQIFLFISINISKPFLITQAGICRVGLLM